MRIFYSLAALFVVTFSSVCFAACTPFDKLPEQAQQDLNTDWTFQADNSFTAEKAANEIRWAKEATERIGKLAGASDLSAYTVKLDDLDAKLKDVTNKDTRQTPIIGESFRVC